jgi:hypothetical protein
MTPEEALRNIHEATGFKTGATDSFRPEQL